MTHFETKRLPADKDANAADGAEVRLLLGLKGGGMAHFQIGPGKTSRVVTHKTVEEIWYFVGGRGEMWRKQGAQEEVVLVEPGVCLTIPLGTQFQFRSLGDEVLSAIGVTMPPWPGEGEARVLADGKWQVAL